MHSAGKNSIVILMAAVLVLASVGFAMASDLSSFSYQQVQIRGKLVKQGNDWMLGDTLRVKGDLINLKEEDVKLEGFLMPGGEKEKPLLYPFRMWKAKRSNFTITKYEGNLPIPGEKTDEIAQQMLAGNDSNYRYKNFNGPFGNMVVYFGDDERMLQYTELPNKTKVILNGTLKAVQSKVEKSADGKENKPYFGIQMDVVGIKKVK
jgi:hypothetical protein